MIFPIPTEAPTSPKSKDMTLNEVPDDITRDQNNKLYTDNARYPTSLVVKSHHYMFTNL